MLRVRLVLRHERCRDHRTIDNQRRGPLHVEGERRIGVPIPHRAPNLVLRLTRIGHAEHGRGCTRRANLIQRPAVSLELSISIVRAPHSLRIRGQFGPRLISVRERYSFANSNGQRDPAAQARDDCARHIYELAPDRELARRISSVARVPSSDEPICAVITWGVILLRGRGLCPLKMSDPNATLFSTSSTGVLNPQVARRDWDDLSLQLRLLRAPSGQRS